MWITIILFAAGIVLVIAEFIVPGGILGALGAVFLIASTAYGWYQFPEYGLYIAVGEFAGLIFSIILGMFLIARTKVAGFMTHQGTQDTGAGYLSPSEDPELLGKEGEVHSDLRPSGWIMINGRRVDAVGDGSYIEKGTKVRIIKVEGHRVVVEPVGNPGDGNG